MGRLADAYSWIFGIRWDRRKAEETLAALLQRERDNAKALSDRAYEESLKRLAEVSKTDSESASKIADDLLVRLAAIQMNRDAALKIAREEFDALDRKMTALSRNFISRWFGRSGWRKPR